MGARTGTFPNELTETTVLENDDTILIARGNNILTASAASIRVNAATYAAIPTLTTSCFVFVTADETNGGQPTIYFFNGTNLNWIPAI